MGEEPNSSWLSSNNYNRFTIFSRIIENTSCSNLDNGNILREVTVKISLERIDTQKNVMVEALLDSGATELVMSLEFARK